MTAPYFDGAQARSGMDTAIFFAAGKFEGTAAMERAKTVCRRCVHRDACLEYALTVQMPTGGYVEGCWGATTTDERKKIRALRERPGAA